MCSLEGVLYSRLTPCGIDVLQVRVQQTVRSQESSIMSYKITNLLHFYLLTMKRTVGPNAIITRSLDE